MGIVMKPFLLEIGKLKIAGYGTMILIGVIVAYCLFAYRGKKRGYNVDNLFDITVFSVIGGFLCAKLLYIVVENPKLLLNPVEIVKTFSQGFVVYGGIIGGFLVFILMCKRYKYNPLKIGDLAVASLAIGQGFGRIGCLLAGCCYGRTTDSVIGITFHDSFIAPNEVSLIPTQIISSIFDFILAGILIWYLYSLEKKNKEYNAGKVVGVYMILYSIGRFIIEFFRGDLERGFIGTLSTSQVISIGIIIFGLIVFNLDKIKRLKYKEGI